MPHITWCLVATRNVRPSHDPRRGVGGGPADVNYLDPCAPTERVAATRSRRPALTHRLIPWLY
jgi:hypothetical protein